MRSNRWMLGAAAVIVAAGCAQNLGNKEFSDCEDCPAMVEIPAGSFMMGTAVADRVPDAVSGRPNTNEEPQHEVVFAQPFAIGRFEITVGQFAAFVADSGFVPTRGCIVLRDGPGRLTVNPELDWRNPGFAQAADEPVVCVSLDDAIAYADWLSRKTGKNYFIPNEAQWEYAAKAGTTGRYFWGEDPARACDYANVTFRDSGMTKEDSDAGAAAAPCDDGYPGLAPVGSFKANAFGVHDPIGNVWEWVVDCNHKNYAGAPADGSAWIDEQNCLLRVIRGGGAGNDLARTTNVVRAGRPKSGTAPNLGFRIARAMGAQAAPAQRAPQTAAAEQPASSWPVEGIGGQLFAANCAACHRDASSYKGLYGTDAASISNLIRNGGNNIMSMPAFGGILTDEQISAVTEYLRAQKGWD